MTRTLKIFKYYYDSHIMKNFTYYSCPFATDSQLNNYSVFMGKKVTFYEQPFWYKSVINSFFLLRVCGFFLAKGNWQKGAAYKMLVKLIIYIEATFDTFGLRQSSRLNLLSLSQIWLFLLNKMNLVRLFFFGNFLTLSNASKHNPHADLQLI